MDITEVLSALMSLLAALATTFLIPWLKSLLGQARLDSCAQWVKIAADAAEQIYAGPGRGAEKKRYVLELLAQKGVSLDSQTLEAMLEAHVLRLRQELGQ